MLPPPLPTDHQISASIKQLEDDFTSIKRDMDLIVKAWTTTFDVTYQEIRDESRLQVKSNLYFAFFFWCPL